MNTIALMGTLQSEPELRHTQDGLACLSFLLGFPAGRADEPDYRIRVIAFGELADGASKTFGHGDAVAVEGRLQAETRNKPDGSKEKVTELVARRLHPAAAANAAAAHRSGCRVPPQTGSETATAAGKEATAAGKTSRKPTAPTGGTPARSQASAGPKPQTPPTTSGANDLDDIPF